ncbi:DUF4389 domain-containing protein [Mariprofundus erugo]|uniref:DUF4389 domain-containing protein n=1 Tax=Mariprofundus erugo TaxID=2528639 RepID=UPI0010FEB3C7|nr:DUF4389 domain-containing protein [Mariprofundus erugo]TLS77096.1 DUF4389 domain-containing protein [Mariprofundus erugo]
MNEELKEHVTNTGVWMRLLFMALFGIIYTVSRFVLLIVVVAQFLWLLITGNTNPRLISFGGQLATFVYQILRYLTFNSETRPFPFADWPDDAELKPGTCARKEEATEEEMPDDVTATSEAADDCIDSGSETGIEAEPATEPLSADDSIANNDTAVETGSETGIEESQAQDKPVKS